MGRPKKRILRQKQIMVRLSNIENIIVDEFVKNTNVTKAVCCREIILNQITKKRNSVKIFPKELKELKYQLLRIGSNINQIVKRVNTQNQMTATNEKELKTTIEIAIDLLKNINDKL